MSIDDYENEILFGPFSTHDNPDGSCHEMMITRSIFEGLYFTNRIIDKEGNVAEQISVSIATVESLQDITAVINNRIKELNSDEDRKIVEGD